MPPSTLRIDNLTKTAELASSVRLAQNPWSRMVGLLGRKGLAEGEGLLLQPCSTIHTLFMRFPIDVLYLDKEANVLKVVPYLKPFRFSACLRHTHYTLELPVGTIDSTNTAPGDRLALVPSQ